MCKKNFNYENEINDKDKDREKNQSIVEFKNQTKLKGCVEIWNSNFEYIKKYKHIQLCNFF